MAIVTLAVLTALSAYLALILYGNTAALWPWAIPLLFALLLWLAVRSLIRLPQVVYEVTDKGITLAGISADPVSWRNILSVSRMSVRGGEVVVLKFAPPFRLPRRGLPGRRAVTLSSHVLRASFSDLWEAVEGAHSAFQARTASASSGVPTP